MIQETGKEGLRSACILDRLSGEEEVLGGSGVELTVVRRAVAVALFACRVFEKKYDAVDRGELVEKGRVEGD